jgi:nucleoside-diphosphate-sugar epimerase
MKVVVTGGSGQLGSLVLRRLIDDRSVRAVRSLDLRPPMVLGDKLEHVIADVRDRDFRRHVDGFDALIHLAFVVSQLDDHLSHSVNVEGSRNVFESAVRAGVSRVVYCSSIAAYGVVHGHDLPLTEDSPRREQTGFNYAATRYQVEDYLDRFEKEHPDIGVIRLRPGVMVGPRMTHPLGDTLFRHIILDANGAPTPVVWDEDVADAVLMALKGENVAGAFNLVADEPIPPYEVSRITGVHILRIPRGLAVALSRLSPLLTWLTGEPSLDPAWIRVSDVPMTASCDRARKVLGWRPRESTSRGVWSRFARTAPFRLHPRIRLFFSVVNEVGRSGQASGLEGYDGRILLALTGQEGGDFTLEVERGRFRIERKIPRPPTTCITVDAPHFLEVLSGHANLRALQATGRMRVEGDENAVAILNELIRTWRGEPRAQPGPGIRWLERWSTRRGGRRSEART